MKVAYKAAANRGFSFEWMPLFIGFGYSKGYHHYDKYTCQQFVIWYLPFCRIMATQYFIKFE
jgi:hypothetical protein